MNQNKPLLTIAIPTYNRAKFLNICLECLLKQVSVVNFPVEILISNNCSTDNTEEIVFSWIEKYPDLIRYNKNESNLGMDGNFIQCFNMAVGQYIWILGDDDYIADGALECILNVLSKQRIGLMHLLIKKDYPDIPEVKLLTKKSEVFHAMSYWITFISANIVNMEYYYAKKIEKYRGTFFTIIPVYYTALSKEDVNAVLNYKVLSGGHDSQRNGGYNLFEVFVKNLLTIIKRFRKPLKLSLFDYEIEKYKLFRNFLCYFIFNFLILKTNNGNFDLKSVWKYLFKYYGYEIYFYCFLLMTPFLFIRHALKKKKQNAFNEN